MEEDACPCDLPGPFPRRGREKCPWFKAVCGRWCEDAQTPQQGIRARRKQLKHFREGGGQGDYGKWRLVGVSLRTHVSGARTVRRAWTMTASYVKSRVKEERLFTSLVRAHQLAEHSWNTECGEPEYRMWRRAGTDDRKCWLQEEQQAVLGADFVLRHETQKLRKTLRGAPYACSHFCLGVCANLHSIISICDSTKRSAIFTTVICPLAYCRTHKSRRVMTATPLLNPFLPSEEITSLPCQLFFVWSPLVFFPSLLSFFTCHFTSLPFFTMKIIHLLKWVTSYIIGLWRPSPPIVLSLVHRWSCPSTGKPINN